jgi:hypothetical protein
VKDVYSARDIVLQFGHFLQENPDMIAFNMRSTNKSRCIELAGLLGWPICSKLITTINYRTA